MMPYPTMDTVGFVSTPSTVAERILNDYRCTLNGQSPEIPNLKSLSKALQENSSNIPGFVSRVQKDLNELYTAYLDDVTVEVNSKSTELADGSENDCVLEIQIRVRYRSGNTYEELGRSIVYDNTGFTRLVELY